MMTLPPRDDDGFGWPPGYLRARALEQADDEYHLERLRQLNAEMAHRDALRMAQRASEVVPEPPRTSDEPPRTTAPDQQEQPAELSEVEHARAILARQPRLSERDFAGALTAALGEKVGRRKANRLRAEATG